MNIRATPDKNQKFTMYSGCSLQRLRNLEKQQKIPPQRQQESNRIKNAEQMGCVPRERVMLKKHNTEREEKSSSDCSAECFRKKQRLLLCDGFGKAVES